MAAVQAEQSYSGQVPRTASSATLPPSYDALITSNASSKPQPSGSEPPPPTYDEAMYLIVEDKNFMTNIKPEDGTEQGTTDQTDHSKP